MRPRLLLSLAAIAAIGVLTVVVVASAFPTPSPNQAVPSLAPTPTPPTTAGAPVGTTYADFVLDPAVVKSPTSSSTQSKLWFAEGAWWGVLFAPKTDRQAIFRLDPKTQVWADTGTLVDERLGARSDALWDGTHLYILSGGLRSTGSSAIRIRRFAFDPKGQRYVLDAGFPVTVNAAGGSPAVITKDSTGAVWAAYTQDGRVWVSHTLGADVHWTAPFGLAVPEAIVDPSDVTAIAAFGPGKVGIVWTNVLRSGVYASVHADGASDDAWSAAETVYDATGIDNELSVAAYPLPGSTAGAGAATGLAATVSTSLDQGGGVHQLDPLTLLATRSVSGSWATDLVGLVRDHHARPVLLVDATAGTIAVAATAPGNGGTIFYKRAPIERLEFDTGPGTPLLTSTTDLQLDGVTSSKAPLTAESGLVALAADRTTGRYAHGFVDLGGGAPTADPADPKRPTTPGAAPAKLAVPVLRDDFESWLLGRADAGWFVRPEDPQGRLSIVDEGGGKRALRVPSAAGGVRACRDIPALPGSPVTIDLRVRVSRAGASDATLISVRGSGGEAGSIRVTTRGVFAWYAGATKVRSTIRFRPRAWYRVVVTLDQARRTYDLRVLNAANKAVAGRTRLRWRTPDVKVVDSVCVETAGGAPAQVVDIGEAKVLVPAS